MTVNSSNKKRIHMNETENKLIGEKILIEDKLIMECYNSQFHESRSFINVNKKVKIRGLFYGCTDINTKHRDDCFITRDGKFDEEYFDIFYYMTNISFYITRNSIMPIN